MSASPDHHLLPLPDGELSPTERAALNEALRHDPAALAAYCDQMRMDALLTWRTGKAVPSATSTTEKAKSGTRRHFLVPSWARWAAALLVLAGAAILVVSPGSSSAAVNRMLAAMERGDRTYRITVLDGEATMTMPNGGTMTYEGATLHLRGTGSFVLMRPLTDGGMRITGSDGHTNWDFAGDGPVKLSTDPQRFRGGIPGEQADAPFLLISEHLAALGENYDRTLTSIPGSPGLLRLTATRRSRLVRGPREIAITFRRDTGSITLMELRGLPRARGGPTSVRLTLTAEIPMPADFFDHHHHHESTRRILPFPPRNP